MKKITSLSTSIIIIALILMIYVQADIEAPQAMTKQASSRHNVSGSYITSSAGAPAQAGNVTYINMTAEGTTKTWAGYYGNISGTIRLENVQGNTLYSWNVAKSGGKVLATESVVTDWSSVYCWNWSKAALNGLRFSEWNTVFNATNGAADAVNETFNASYSYTPFYITGRLFSNVAGTQDGGRTGLCPAIELFNNSGRKSGQNQFEEIILGRVPVTSTSSFHPNQLIYLALIERDKLGFTGESVDFQMIVPQDGHLTGFTSIKNYYFYVELEAS